MDSALESWDSSGLEAIHRSFSLKEPQTSKGFSFPFSPLYLFIYLFIWHKAYFQASFSLSSMTSYSRTTDSGADTGIEFEDHFMSPALPFQNAEKRRKDNTWSFIIGPMSFQPFIMMRNLPTTFVSLLGRARAPVSPPPLDSPLYTHWSCTEYLVQCTVIPIWHWRITEVPFDKFYRRIYWNKVFLK